MTRLLRLTPTQRMALVGLYRTGVNYATVTAIRNNLRRTDVSALSGRPISGKTPTLGRLDAALWALQPAQVVTGRSTGRNRGDHGDMEWSLEDAGEMLVSEMIYGHVGTPLGDS